MSWAAEERFASAMSIMNAGLHQFVWDGSNASSGVYFVLLQADGIAQTRKIVLMK